jgi:hypothetical protein
LYPTATFSVNCNYHGAQEPLEVSKIFELDNNGHVKKINRGNKSVGNKVYLDNYGHYNSSAANV